MLIRTLIFLFQLKICRLATISLRHFLLFHCFCCKHTSSLGKPVRDISLAVNHWLRARESQQNAINYIVNLDLYRSSGRSIDSQVEIVDRIKQKHVLSQTMPPSIQLISSRIRSAIWYKRFFPLSFIYFTVSSLLTFRLLSLSLCCRQFLCVKCMTKCLVLLSVIFSFDLFTQKTEHLAP